MDLEIMSNLTLDDSSPTHGHRPPEGTDRYMAKLKAYADSLPYSIESNSRMQEMLDFGLLRLCQSVEARDHEGFCQWDSMLSYWSILKYPIPKEKRIRLIRVYFHLATLPGMPTHMIVTAHEGLQFLTRSKKKSSIEDLRLPWRPLFDILSQELFPSQRQFELSQIPYYMGCITENVRRFFHPAAIPEMLSTFLPLMNGLDLTSLLASQYYMLTFLPLSHPQSYLPVLFRIWESINSYMYDDRMLHFLSSLIEIHMDPSASDPCKIKDIPDDAISMGEARPQWKQDDLQHSGGRWKGIFKDVGIFTESEWNLLMSKCLASMEIVLADSGSLNTGPSADNQISFEINRLPKPDWRIPCLAHIIVYSMAPDGHPSPPSSLPTPAASPFQSGTSTPIPQENGKGALGDFLSAPLAKGVFKTKTYLAGSRALDSLVRLVASTESFFHPSNSGAWTTDLSAFIKCIVEYFNKRWNEEEKPDCKTPLNRRLTKDMKRELVKSLRTVTLLAMFSQDSNTVANIQYCLRSMSLLEPDLILQPILERAVPSLEALVETQRTIAIIKALEAVAPAMVSRQIYYPGAQNLLNVLELLIPGIDLNDPLKTLCTTAFLAKISQHIKFGDLTTKDAVITNGQSESTTDDYSPVTEIHIDGVEPSMDTKLSREEEDIVLKNTTGGFPGWIASFIRRVILLLENLPEESANGTVDGTTEAQLVDAVTGACTQICAHLSENLYDMVLNMIYDYASTNVRSNAVRAIHQLLQCVANANPEKTLTKFFYFCESNIRIELENGASSLRTTGTSTPLPSDATLHWNLAILRGAMYNDGRTLLKYKDNFLSLLQLLRDKTFSKRGYSWSGKLLTGVLLTLSHIYPRESRFVNPDEWNSAEFRNNHHKYWGKLYKPEEIKMSWHVPSDAEIAFVIDIFKRVIEPTLELLESLLTSGALRDPVWRNDFCRYLSFVRNAFAGIPSLMREVVSDADKQHAIETTDLLNEIPEMIGSITPVNTGFPLNDPTDPRHEYITSLRRRFGEFLHRASASLRQQGEENTLDAVHGLIRSIRTYLLDYGDSRDSYYLQLKRYASELEDASQYTGQKVWPRAVFVRRARCYHSARLFWTSVDRRRSPLEDALIDELTEWSMWHYPSVRETSQSTLDTLSSRYDGVRRRCLPTLYTALDPGTDDDRMKGALWTLNIPCFAKYAISEPSLAPELVRKLFGCQHNEKPSIQDCVSTLAENCINSFVEPCHLVYDIQSSDLNQATGDLRSVLLVDTEDLSLVKQCRQKRIERIAAVDKSIDELILLLLNVANSPKTHWRYAIAATRCLRTLVRKDEPTSVDHLKCFIEQIYDDHPTIRYYSQRALMKSLRFLKLRSSTSDPVQICLEKIQKNPLKKMIQLRTPSHELTDQFLADYKSPVDLSLVTGQPVFCEKFSGGWLVWGSTTGRYLGPAQTQSTFHSWEESSMEAVAMIEKLTTTTVFWEKLSTHYTAENFATSLSQDNISTVKSVFQLLEDVPFESLKPVLEKFISDTDQNKQRGAAELIAGVLGGSKHWPVEKQNRLWEWFLPHMKKIFKQNIKTDTLPIWTSFLDYLFYKRDPRRVQPLVDYLVNEFESLDFDGESAFDISQVLCFFRAFYEGLNWKFYAWTDDMVRRIWTEIGCEHDDVRTYIGEILAFAGRIRRRPRPSIPDAETFVRECRTLPADYDIMDIRGKYHLGRVHELVKKLKVWREERLPGARAFQSTYDRVGILVCKWLFQTLHDTEASSAFDYIVPLMPELFRFTEVNDDEELASRAELVLTRMCGVIPPRSLINSILDSIFEAIQSSPSWRVRLKVLPLVQVFYFRQVPLISEGKIFEIVEVVCRCLDDEVVEVREKAATTLSGIIRISPHRSVVTLKNRFLRLLRRTTIPDRKAPTYNLSIRQRHAAILGICALIESYPYTVERFMPELLTSVLAEHTYDPVPISTTVRKCASNFKKTHQDTWHEDSKRFTEDQLAALSTLLTGSSYYA